MKKILLCLLICTSSFSQGKNLIDFNAFSATDGELNVDYQRFITEWYSLGLRYFATSGVQSLENSAPVFDENYYGYGISNFFYINKWYFNINILKLNHEFSDGQTKIVSDENIVSYGVGYNWRWETLSVKLGLELRDIPQKYDEAEFNGSSITSKISDDTKLDIRVGWIF